MRAHSVHPYSSERDDDVVRSTGRPPLAPWIVAQLTVRFPIQTLVKTEV